MRKNRKKMRGVLHPGCYQVNIHKLQITRYYQDKKGGGFRDIIGGFKTGEALWEYVVENE